MYSPRVEYIVAGQTYTVTSHMSSNSRPSVGSTQRVGYNPGDPSEARVDEGVGGIAFLSVFAGLGVLGILLGPILYIRSRRRTAAINKLVQSGQKVTGVVTGISSNRNGTNQNSQAFVVEVSATDLSGTVRQFTSDSLTGLGPLAMMDFQANPIAVDVYIDPANPDNYYVDISDLPNLTPARIAELIAQKLPGNKPIQSFDATPATTGAFTATQKAEVAPPQPATPIAIPATQSQPSAPPTPPPTQQ